MNKLTKIGLSALAGSLVAVSAHAGSMSVSGSASLTISDGDVDNTQGTAAEGNLWTMGDSLTFSGGGELDNGMTVAVKYEYDDDEADANENSGGFDSHSITLSSAEMGSITFAGHGGGGALDAMDDKTPNAFEEAWDITADTTAAINGYADDNMFTYKSPSVSGAVLTIGYVPGGSKEGGTPNGGYADFGITVKPEAVEGLEVGFAMGETEETVGTTIDEQAMYAKYSYGSLTVGYQKNETDGPAASNDVEFTAIGVTYAVTDDITIGYGQSTYDLASDADDQEATGLSASFTSGGMTIAGGMNSADNVNNGATDAEGYEFNISFAF